MVVENETLMREHPELAQEVEEKRTPVGEYVNPSVRDGGVVYAMDQMDDFVGLSPERFNAGKYKLDLRKVPGRVVLTPISSKANKVVDMDLGDFMERGGRFGDVIYRVMYLPVPGPYYTKYGENIPFYEKVVRSLD